jgi:hypothetical protein
MWISTRSIDKVRSWHVIHYPIVSLDLAKYPPHQIIGLKAEAIPPCDVMGSFLLAFLYLSLSVGAILGSQAGSQLGTDLLSV